MAFSVSSNPAEDDVSSSAIIIKPIRTEGVDVFFFFVPGALTAPQEYRPLLDKVQSECSCLRLWVAILDPGAKPWISTAMIEASFDGVLERVKKLGFPVGIYPSKNIIFGGHSWGAWEARSVALKRADAFIQLGSCFHSNPDNLMQYPKPVLTMSGALDAQITNAAVVKHAGEIYAKKQELGDHFVYVVKPVILVPGMNHAQFSHGRPNKERGDFDAEISLEEARDVSSGLIASFITVHTCGPAEVTAAKALNEAVSWTQEQYKVFWEAMEEPGTDVKRMQLEIMGIPSLAENNVGVVEHEYKDNFIFSKPWIDARGERIVVNTFLHAVGKYNLLSNLWVKFKSREAGLVVWGDRAGSGKAAASADGLLQCRGADFNERTHKLALSMVPDVVRKKFEQRGKKLRFLEDVIVTTSAQEWINSDVTIKPAEDGSDFVDVQSPAMITPLQAGFPERFAGMHYLKLLTLARALSWIYEDSFR